MTIAAFLPLVGTLLDKFIPDPEAQAEAKLKMLKMAQEGELAAMQADLQLALGQMEINKEEAKADLFRGGWRPLIGYIIGCSLAFQYLVNPLLLWMNALFNLGVTPPDIQLDGMMWELMFGLLGLGGLRTYERIKGKA